MKHISEFIPDVEKYIKQIQAYGPEHDAKVDAHRSQADKQEMQQAIDGKLERVLAQLGPSRGKPFLRPHEMDKTHPSTIAAFDAFEAVKKSDYRDGAIFRGPTGSGKSTAISILAGLILRIRHRYSVYVERNACGFADKFGSGQSTWQERDGLLTSRLVIFDDVRPPAFSSQNAQDRVRGLMQELLDRADTGDALLLIGTSCDDNQLGEWMLPDTLRRFRKLPLAELSGDPGKAW